MIGLVARSSSSVPTSGSETVIGVPRGAGVAVATGVGRNVPGTATTRGVAVGGGRVGRGVSGLGGLNDVAVGAGIGGDDAIGPHAQASVINATTGNRRCI